MNPADQPIAIAMATYEPDPELFRHQIESIRAQRGCLWHCFISDDNSSDAAFAAIGEVIGDDDRFTVERSPGNVGFYRNFERAISMVPAEYDLIALSDQDDRWYEDKLETLASGIGPAGMIYSDQRLVDEAGNLIAGTYWTERQNNHTNLTSLLVANTVTGAASMFRRRVADAALPFPEVPGEQYHDHWLALVALATGELAYVDRPLYDYVQHGGAVLGYEKANAGLRSAGWRRIDPRRWREILGGWASAYFDVYLRLQGLARITLERCSGSMSSGKRRELARFAGSDRSVTALLWLAFRPLRRLVGKNETLGMERVLVRGILYRHLAAIRRRLPARLKPDTGLRAETEVTPQMRQKVAPLFPVVSKTQPARINLLIPTIDLDHLFGGYIAKFNLARRLAESGHEVRIVTVDPTPPLPADWREKVEGFSQLEGLFDRVDVIFGRDGREPLRISPDDRFIATTWWTAHIASRLAAQTGTGRFLYMIQEYEPLTVPGGAWADLAAESYGLPHNALFSTGILRDHFRDEGIGVFVDGREEGDRRSAVFTNAITPVPAPSAATLAGRKRPSLLLYGRPESHAARNLYDVAVESLRRAVSEGTFGSEWDFFGIGSTGEVQQVDLGSGRRLELRPRTDQEGYARFLISHDVGISLMDAPHPSLVPVEMASAGMLVVTTTWGSSKTADKLGAISPNLIARSADVEGVTDGLREAVSRVGHFDERVAAADVKWSSDWNVTFDRQTMARIEELTELH